MDLQNTISISNCLFSYQAIVFKKVKSGLDI